MTTPNAFQQAAAQAAQTAPTSGAPAGNLAGSYAPAETSSSSQLFSGPVLPPSLLNKSHPLGTECTGKIVTAPHDVQSRDFNSKKPKFWAESPLPDGKKISLEPLDHVTGEKLRPVMDTIIELGTDYRFDAAESAAIERDPNMPDDGSRAFYASGDDLKQIRAEIRRLGFTSEQDMIGATFTVKRVGQKPNPGANPSWINKITMSR